MAELKRIRFMQNQFLDRTMTFSSQMASFPASNLTNTSRSKVWRPAGNFEITTANQRIWFNDGTNKDVNVALGSYLPASLATAITASLNIFSTGWTCTYSFVTNSFTITRSSGTAILRLSVTTDAIWDTIGYTAVTDFGPSLSLPAMEPRNHTSEWIQCDTGVPQAATFGGLIAGIDRAFTLSGTATVKFRANNINVWTAPPLDITGNPADFGFMRWIEDISTATYRFHRVELIDRLNPAGPEGIELAYAYVGDHFTLTNTGFAKGFSETLVDPSKRQSSIDGALFVETRPRYWQMAGGQIQLLSDQEFADIKQVFYDLGQRTPFFISIDPELRITPNLGELTKYVIMEGNPTAEQVLHRYFNISFAVREAF